MILILTDRDEFRYIDPAGVSKLMRNRIISDTGNSIDIDMWQKAGYKTYLLGASDIIKKNNNSKKDYASQCTEDITDKIKKP